MQVLTFKLGGDLFGVEVDTAREIIEWSPLSFIPRAPEFALGIINYHGRVITVVDIARFFDINSLPPSLDTKVIILASDEYQIGLKIDRAERIEVFPDEVAKGQGEIGAKEKEYIRAVLNLNGGVFNLLDVERIFEEIEDYFT